MKQGERQHVFDDDDGNGDDDDDDDDDNNNNNNYYYYFNYKVGQVHIFQFVHYGSIARI